METVKNILLVIYVIVCIALIFITTSQSKASTNPAEDTYENPNANKYFEKNKSRTKAGKTQKRTIVISVVFAILTVVTTIVYFL